MKTRDMTANDLRTLPEGSIVRHRLSGNAYVVIQKHQDSMTAVRSVEVSSAHEWLVIVDKDDAAHPAPTPRVEATSGYVSVEVSPEETYHGNGSDQLRGIATHTAPDCDRHIDQKGSPRGAIRSAWTILPGQAGVDSQATDTSIGRRLDGPLGSSPVALVRGSNTIAVDRDVLRDIAQLLSGSMFTFISTEEQARARGSELYALLAASSEGSTDE